MLAHLPGQMSQPSRKGITSNIFILRCSFHKTAKRLSITGLTHSLICDQKYNPVLLGTYHQNTQQQTWQSGPVFYATLTGTNPSLSLTGLSYTTCDFATNKSKKREKRSITNNTKLSVWLTNSRPHSKWRHKNITDWITSQKPISRSHPINLNNNITDISQKKDLPKKRKRYKISIAYLCDTSTIKVKIAFCNTATLH